MHISVLPLEICLEVVHEIIEASIARSKVSTRVNLIMKTPPALSDAFEYMRTRELLAPAVDGGRARYLRVLFQFGSAALGVLLFAAAAVAVTPPAASPEPSQGRRVDSAADYAVLPRTRAWSSRTVFSPNAWSICCRR